MTEEFFPSYLAIGGAMELNVNSPIIQYIKSRVGEGGKIVVLPTASNFGDEVGPMYVDIFKRICDDVSYHLINKREDCHNTELLSELREATVIFFTGGDQLKITSLIGGSPVMDIIGASKENGVFIAGTSAGASAMSDTMISYGPADSMIKGNLKMSPGMGLVSKFVIDSHFVKRGRISRLMHMVATNPGCLGVGLSEDTGILIDMDKNLFEVIGSRQVVIVDGRDIKHSNIAAIQDNRPFSVTDVRVHVLGPKFRYNIENNTVLVPSEVDYDLILSTPSKLNDLPYRPIEDNNW